LKRFFHCLKMMDTEKPMLHGDFSDGYSRSSNLDYEEKEKSEFFGDRSCLYVFFSLAGLVGFVFVFLVVIFGLSWPPTHKEPCFNGSTLKLHEQMWCSPAWKMDVQAIRQNHNITFYRFKTYELPNLINQTTHIHEKYFVPPYQIQYFSFSLLAGSRIVAELMSGDPDDDWYLVDDPAMSKLLALDRFDAIKQSKANMTFDFEVVTSAKYYIVVYHTRGEDSLATFDLVVTSLTYDLSSAANTEVCKDEKECDLKEVEPDETIIAVNNWNDTLTAQLTPYEIDSLNAFFYLFFPILLGLIAAGLVIFPLIMRKKAQRSSSESIPFSQGL